MSTRWTPPALGRRGEGWVALQVVVIVLSGVVGVVGAPWPAEVKAVLRWAGGAVLAGGLVLSLVGMAQLGPALTPFPKPGDAADLRERGPYRWVRHPIYGGLLIAVLGWSFATSPLTLVTAVLLAAVFWAKSLREEAWLEERYPGYPAYREHVRRRFVPFVW